jgi:hypothetical protein
LKDLRNLLLTCLGALAVLGLPAMAVTAILGKDICVILRSVYLIAGSLGLLMAAVLLMAERLRRETAHYRAYFQHIPVLALLLCVSATLLGGGGLLDYLIR